MITFDPSKATNGDFGVLPPGDYECIIESGTVKRGADTGTEYIDFMLTVRDDVDGQSYGGRKLWGKLFNTENTQGILQGFLKNINTPEGTNFNNMEELKNYAVGKAISAKVDVETYQGKERNSVKYMNKSKVGGGKIDDPFTPVGSDPFAPGEGPITISDDDLPF